MFKKLRQAQSILDEFSSPARLADIKVSAASKSGDLASLLGGTSDAQGSSSVSTPAREYQPGEPRKEDFTNLHAYLQAKIRWSKVVKAKKESAAQQAVNTQTGEL